MPEVYSSLDLSLGRGQLTKARDVFAFIDTVRADSSASVERRLEYLRAIEGISISDEVGRTILESVSYTHLAEMEALDEQLAKSERGAAKK